MSHYESAATLSRRGFLGASAAVGAFAVAGALDPRSAGSAVADTATPALLPLRIAATTTWQINQVALTDDNTMFVSGPRNISPDQATPSLGRRQPDGTIVPFPGNSWNDWQPGDSGWDQFVNPIELNIFWDNTVWVCDWGAPMSDSSATPAAGAQKIVQLDPHSGRVLRVLRFDDSILPPGAKLNGLQLHGDYLYVADSGLGAIIFHDLRTGQTLRRLSGDPTVTATAESKAANSSNYPNAPDHSDTLHLTDDGEWLYWAPPQGPLRRARAALVRDQDLSDAELAAQVEYVADVAVLTGSTMDTLGNLYLSYLTTEGFMLMPPAPRDNAERTTILQLSAPNPAFTSPDEGFISSDRRLYTPCSQLDHGASASAPWTVYVVDLPQKFAGYPLGNRITGRPKTQRTSR